jgi:bla regulator protein BlaR1
MTDWLLGTMLATSGLILLVLLIREPVRRHFGARVAYGLWLIPAARLLMPTLTETIERPVTMSFPPQPGTLQVSAEPMLLSSVAPPPEPSLIDQMGGWPTILLILWLGVAAGLFAARMLAFRRDRAVILANCVELDRIGSIRLVRSAEVSGPIAFGIFDRVIAVPADFDRLYADRERRLALDHELAHHRSGDLVANLFAFVLLCLQWFNPLAWVAHAAFRFDQEAACDARVLDKVKAQDRVDYGRAIAKAASGRALLFASALDRRNSLHRRLKSMLSNPSAGRRLAGRLTVIAAVAVALPLTATRAVEYVDVPVLSASRSLAAPVAALQALPAAQPAAPAQPAHPARPLIVDGKDMIMIDGESKQWKQLTPAEKDEVRRSIVHAKQELARTKVDREKIQREIREAMEEAKANQADLRRELAKARAEIEKAARDIDANAADIRRSGQDPEQIKAQIRASLKAAEAIDIEAITRVALSSVDQRQIEATVAASMAAAEASIAKAQADIERLEVNFDDD